MSMDLTGIMNRNEYYTNHYFASIFEENAADTIRAWREAAHGTELRTPWALLRDSGKRYFLTRGRQERRRGEIAYAEAVTEIARDLMTSLGYDVLSAKPELEEIPNVGKVPVALEISKENGAPLLWTILTSSADSADQVISNDDETDVSDILSYVPMTADLRPDCVTSFTGEQLLRQPMEELLGRLLYDLDESPRWIVLISGNQIALIDRNKWNEKRFLVFDLDMIFGRNEESTLQAMTVLLHRDSLCPKDGGSLLDVLDDNSHKHATEVSGNLKFALRQCIEILGNEVVHDMKERQHVAVFGRALAEDLTLQCLRYMYRILFMLFIEAKPELGYAPMKAQTYESGYSFESLREICEQAQGDGEINEDGNFLKESLDKLFGLVYTGFPTKVEAPADSESLQGVFAVEPLKAHIFDPERTALIEKAHLRNGKLQQIINLMSLSRGGKGQRRGRISYSNLGVNQLGAVYEALLSYRGFFAEEDLYEVKRAGDKVNDLDVGYFIPLRELDQYTEDERVRNEDGTLRVHPKGKFIYRLAGREREKSASYYTPEVLTRCLVKYALKELLEGKSADDILALTICEPAMGSAAFLNEAVSQLAEAYLERKQKETGVSIPHDQRQQELQKVKMLIADRNVYGIDLNPTAVELAEVSLWLNTIYQGGYVPWFRTQIVNGNSLIGARRQCYTLSQAQAEGAGAWYNSAPERVAPGTNRSLRRQQVYHFLLGDPSMCAYTDKVIKGLEPEKIAAIKKWNKAFTRPLNDSEADDVLRLCNQIDALWDAHTQLRAEIKDKTTDPLSVWGQPQDEKHRPTTIRDKDRIYESLYLSKGGSNASPYARLKAVMDYWCALWFWPIDKADELPSRMEFLWDVNMLLGVDVVDTSGRKGQLSMFDDLELDPYARELSDRYGKYGAVNLDQLRGAGKTPEPGTMESRLRIADEVAQQQHFFHWELEFADVFAERGGFDLIVGNPPWIKIKWEETYILSENKPVLAIHSLNAKQVADIRDTILLDYSLCMQYINECTTFLGMQNYISARSNYLLLQGQQTNLFKCFLPQAWTFGSMTGVAAFVHPEGVFDDPNGAALRMELYPRLRKHFQFRNEMRLFPEVHHSRIYSLNIYCNETTNSFESISNLFSPESIDECYDESVSCDTALLGLKNENGEWNTRCSPKRVIHVGSRELKAFATMYDGDSASWRSARLPVLHIQDFMDVVVLFANQQRKVVNLQGRVFGSRMWDETNAQKDGTIKRSTGFPADSNGMIVSGPHLGLANPLFKTPRKTCKLNSDYDNIDLQLIGDHYVQRSNYTPACSAEVYERKIPKTPWGANTTVEYRLATRAMVDPVGRRSLISAIIPPYYGHINSVFAMNFADYSELAAVAAMFVSLPVDFIVKSTGKSAFLIDGAEKLPLFSRNEYLPAIARICALNCVTKDYSELWKSVFSTSFLQLTWSKTDSRLDPEYFCKLSEVWSYDTPLRSDYARRQALLEIDVITAQLLKMTLEQLIGIYRVQFSILQSQENETWYDTTGRIVFTTDRSMVGVGFDRKTWETEVKGAPAGKKFYRTITDDTQPGGPVQRTIEYVAPFDRCDREKDYEAAWAYFSKQQG
ncbi:MAG: class I SAM-dependent DNA methyltransferase [Clostridia bacterium]|nr:class I SAM-dependent DNA methyltransferase [Clostridia bacterium]